MSDEKLCNKSVRGTCKVHFVVQPCVANSVCVVHFMLGGGGGGGKDEGAELRLVFVHKDTKDSHCLPTELAWPLLDLLSPLVVSFCRPSN